MRNQLSLYIIEMNADRARCLRSEVKHLPQVTVLETYADAVTASGGFDAILVPLMAALDWGIVTPPVPLHQTCVVKTPDTEVARGRPKYAIPGIAISAEDSLSPIETTRLVPRESFKAIRNFNQTSSNRLKSVGATAISLGLDKLSAGESTKALSYAYQTFNPMAESSDTTPNYQLPTTLTA